MIHALAHFIGLPNIHPAVVHYPVALAFTALLVELAWWVFRRGRWLERAGALLYGLAAVAAGFAYLAGRGAAEQVGRLAPAAEAVLAEHADLALWTLLVLGGAAVLRLLAVLFASWDAPVRPNALHILAALGLLGGCGLVGATAQHGGELVYRYGVAVANETPEASPVTRSPTPTPTPSGPPETRLHTLPGGGLDWQPDPTDAAALGTLLQAAPGSDLDAVRAAPPEQGDTGLAIAVDGQALLVFQPSYGDVEVDAELELLDFGGRIGLASHVQDVDRAVLFTVDTRGHAALAARTAQGPESLATSQAAVTDAPFTLTLSSASRHFKGFLDDHLLVHGHVDAGGPGQVGLFFDGSGTVVVQRLRVTPAAGATPTAANDSE